MDQKIDLAIQTSLKASGNFHNPKSIVILQNNYADLLLKKARVESERTEKLRLVNEAKTILRNLTVLPECVPTVFLTLSEAEAELVLANYVGLTSENERESAIEPVLQQLQIGISQDYSFEPRTFDGFCEICPVFSRLAKVYPNLKARIDKILEQTSPK